MGTNRNSGSSSSFRSLLQVACILAMLGGCLAVWRLAGVAVTAARRVVPAGQWVQVEILVSLAIDPDDRLVEQLTQAVREGSPAAPPAGLRAALSKLLGPIRAVWTRLAQVCVEWQLDVAAVPVQGGTRLAVTFPIRLRIVPGPGRVGLLKVSSGGEVVVEVGGRQVRLAPGEGFDTALVPTPDGYWSEDPRPWREVIISRIARGLPVGRLSVTNLGLQPQPR